MAASLLKDVQPKAQNVLTGSTLPMLRRLRVDQTSAGLIISGTVSSFYHKQLAQEAVRAVAGSVPIVNSVRVT